MNLAVGLWSLRNKCNQAIQRRGRPACGAPKRWIHETRAPHAGLPLLWLHYLFKEGERDWRLQWERDEATIAEEAKFDGISLMCTNTPASDLSANEVVSKYKEQIQVEQTIDFIKSPVELRPTWLHHPKRIAGLTLLIMIAVLVAMLLEYKVRRLLTERRKNI